MDGCSYAEPEATEEESHTFPPGSVIHVPNATSIIYNIGFNVDCADAGYFEEEDDAHAVYTMLMEKCEGKTLSDIKLKFGDLHLINSCGFNEDHRGSDHTMIKLDFHDDYELPDMCSLEEFANACYRLKSHKFDYWYELFCGCSVTRDEDNNTVTITISFDHGS